MVLKVYYPIDPDTEALGILRSHLQPGVQLSTGQTFPSQPDFQVLINGTPTREQLVKSIHLESLVIPYAGIPQSTRRIMAEFPRIKVYNLHHNAAPTAEMAVALLLAAAKRLVPIDQAFRQGAWLPYHQAEQSMLLEGKTVLVLGFGQIGQRVGLICQALGMQVIGIRRNAAKALIPGLQAEVHTIEKLEQLLPRSQVLIITLPITEQTQGLVGAKQLSRMVPGGLLINVGRGNVVDQAALYQALTDGTLSAAGIDVWYNYPDAEQAGSRTTPADFPFHELDNVVMSPHRGGGSRDTEMLRMHHLAELLNVLNQGEPTPSQVDLSAGY